MNKIITIALAIVLGLTIATSSQAAGKKTSVYAFGFSASFNDSTVYFTDIQQVQNVTLEHKTRFLQNREGYSHQLKDYLTERGEGQRVCVFLFDANRKKIEKQFTKLRRKYSRDGRYDIKYLPSNDFKFTTIESDEDTEAAPEPVEKVSKKKKQRKGKGAPESAPVSKE